MIGTLLVIVLGASVVTIISTGIHWKADTRRRHVQVDRIWEHERMAIVDEDYANAMIELDREFPGVR